MVQSILDTNKPHDSIQTSSEEIKMHRKIRCKCYQFFGTFSKMLDTGTAASSYRFCSQLLPVPQPAGSHPNATSSIIIRVKPAVKAMVPILVCFPWDISGINSSTTT